MQVQAQPGTTDFKFDNVGDIVNVSSIQSMTLSPMNVDENRWGVALLKLQANIPDTLPGQNVTFLLFGDVEITNAVNTEIVSDQKPMQAFYLKTGTGDAQCAEAPESGMLVQTPEGVGEVNFNINGVDVEMGSTVFFQSAPEEGMTVSTLEGAAYITADDETTAIVPGTWARVPVTQRLVPMRVMGGGTLTRALIEASGKPEPPKSYENSFRGMQSLPLGILDRKIEMAPPLDADKLTAIQEHLKNGGAVCGEGPMPACPKGLNLPANANQDCVMRPGPNDPPLPADEKRPFCETVLPDDGRDCVFPPGPNDPPLPDNETRPFCAPPNAGEMGNVEIPPPSGIGRPGGIFGGTPQPTPPSGQPPTSKLGNSPPPGGNPPPPPPGG
ncbi:MAG: hypothetical protein R3E39_20550 [Anaerolineae bacterium]